MSDQQSSFDSVLSEDRVFPPSPDAGASLGGAWIDSMESYRDLHAKSVADPEDSGPQRPRISTGSVTGTRCWNGTCPMPAGSSAAP